jgi:orotate phosphoribosyltransferase
MSNYQTLIKVAAEGGYISSKEMDTLSQWRKDPANWKK